MSILKSINEGFDRFSSDMLYSDLLESINKILRVMNEAPMSDEDRYDSEILRNIMKKAREVEYDKRRALRFTPEEQAVADKYNLTLPAKGRNGIVPIKDNEIDVVSGTGINRGVRELGTELGPISNKRNANLADFVRKRKERGDKADRPYKSVDPYAPADPEEVFGDTTFTHDNTGRFTQDDYDKKYGRAGNLSNKGWGPANDLTDVEKDRVAVNKQMSQPVRDMKAALKDRKRNQKDLDDVNLKYSDDVKYARDEFERRMKDAEETKARNIRKGTQGVADANSRINSLLRKEELEFSNKLREYLRNVNEAEMSDEDKKDNELLKNIYLKTQQRANAKLTPEEQAVLKKYGLERRSWSKNIVLPGEAGQSRDSNIIDQRDFEGTWKNHKRVPPKADKINYADRARKRGERSKVGYDDQRWDYYISNAPDYESDHRDKNHPWGGTFQDRHRKADNNRMYEPVGSMKKALDDRKSAQKGLDTIDAKQDAEVEKLRKEFDRRMADIEYWRTQSKKYDQNKFDTANNTIDTLLKRK